MKWTNVSPWAEAWAAQRGGRAAAGGGAFDVIITTYTLFSVDSPGRPVHVDPIKRTLKAPGTKRLKQYMTIRFQKLLSNATCAATPRSQVESEVPSGHDVFSPGSG